jgi:hypothetical protein
MDSIIMITSKEPDTSMPRLQAVGPGYTFNFNAFLTLDEARKEAQSLMGLLQSFKIGVTIREEDEGWPRSYESTPSAG